MMWKMLPPNWMPRTTLAGRANGALLCCGTVLRAACAGPFGSMGGSLARIFRAFRSSNMVRTGSSAAPDLHLSSAPGRSVLRQADSVAPQISLGIQPEYCALRRLTEQALGVTAEQVVSYLLNLARLVMSPTASAVG